LELGWAEYVAFALAVLGAIAEWLHRGRVRRLARLAFGPSERPRNWTRLAPLLRVLSLAALGWGLTTLLWIEPAVHNVGEVDENKQKHLILIVDVSPSMYLVDAGQDQKVERRKRASEILESLFERIPVRQYKISVVAVYTEARPVLEDSADVDIVKHFLETIPMYHAFEPGQTDLFKGLEIAAEIASPWRAGSAIVVMLTDGDSVPATGMPRMPNSVAKVLIVGVGDERTGRFIDGHQSRQDTNTLRQLAHRLRGIYHNGNQQHISSQTIAELVQLVEQEKPTPWSRREWALLAVATGASVYGFLPVLLYYFGTAWRPGRRPAVDS